MSWYQGTALLDQLETIEIENDRGCQPMRFPVQLVNRPHLNFRSAAGTVASGRIAVGDENVVANSGHTTRVARIVTMDGDLPVAEASQSVSLVFADEVDASRGDVLCHPTARLHVVNKFAAHLIWMGDEALLPGRSYLMRSADAPCPRR
jgi:bifunctional enzyme CysN/CysC